MKNCWVVAICETTQREFLFIQTIFHCLLFLFAILFSFHFCTALSIHPLNAITTNGAGFVSRTDINKATNGFVEFFREVQIKAANSYQQDRNIKTNCIRNFLHFFFSLFFCSLKYFPSFIWLFLLLNSVPAVIFLFASFFTYLVFF